MERLKVLARFTTLMIHCGMCSMRIELSMKDSPNMYLLSFMYRVKCMVPDVTLLLRSNGKVHALS
jgi:hypothetical protein